MGKQEKIANSLFLRLGSFFDLLPYFPPTFGSKKKVRNVTIKNKQKPATCDHQGYQKERIERTNQILGVYSFSEFVSGMGVMRNK